MTDDPSLITPGDPSREARAVRRAARDLVRVLRERDDAILAMHRAGFSLRAIAREADMTAAGVQKIIARLSD